MSCNLVIKDGKLFNRGGSSWRAADIAAKNGKIDHICKFRDKDGAHIIDASNLCANPSWIDACKGVNLEAY